MDCKGELKMKKINSTMLVVLVLMLTSSAAIAEGWGNLKVRLVFGGDVPVPAKINVNKDVNFCGKHGLVDEGLLVNKENKGIANVIVYVRDKDVSVHPSYESDDPIMVDNAKCRFSPHVTPVWTKRTLMLKNSDPVGHNVKVDTFLNPPINPVIPSGAALKQTYSKTEPLPTKISCSIHPWMTGWLVIRDNPYVGVADKNGLVEIKNIPAGELEFQFWQEKVGYVREVELDGKTVLWNRGRVKLTIEDGETLDLGDVTVPAKLVK
mgnify:CR=1 FL=1